jgi:hypothetical protein
MSNSNDNLVLISGTSTSGKSASLMNLKNPEGVMYLNAEAGKKLPFAAKFRKGPDNKVGFVITDPYQVFEAFEVAEKDNSYHTIVIDSISFLLEMYESVHVIPSTNTMASWSGFAQYFKKLMQQYVPNSSKNIIMTAHTLSILNENEMIVETRVPVKGALKNVGIESYFSTVVSTKKVPIKKLKEYGSDILIITPEEEALQFKYCFQTKLTKDTVHERIRSPLGMFSTKETYMNNDAQMLLDRLREYYTA